MCAVLATKTMDEVELEDSGRCVGLRHIDTRNTESLNTPTCMDSGGILVGLVQTVKLSFGGLLCGESYPLEMP